ncbi:hypothetical protein E0I56_005735 [Escherichia coli]|nr:hypothetical protein [Escherichia coli]
MNREEMHCDVVSLSVINNKFSLTTRFSIDDVDFLLPLPILREMPLEKYSEANICIVASDLEQMTQGKGILNALLCCAVSNRRSQVQRTVCRRSNTPTGTHAENPA